MKSNALDLKGFFSLFCFGGVAVVSYLISFLVQSRFHSGFNFYFQLSALLALLIYQPHFIATYQINYSRGMPYLKKYPYTFFFFPVLLLFLVVAALFSLIGPVQLNWVLGITIIAAIYHFSFQAAAISIFLSEKNLKDHPLLKSFIKLLFSTTAAYALLRLIQHNSGSYSFYDHLALSNIQIAPLVTSILFGVLVVGHVCFLGLVFHYQLGWKILVPWLAYVLTHMSDFFIFQYYFMIPVLHAIQFLPFYIGVLPSKGRIKKIALVVIASLALVFALPNLLGHQSALLGTQIFAAILLAMNLHHFAMERVTWKGASKLLEKAA